MFRGVDRAKYDLTSPSAFQAMDRDAEMHKEALLTVSRYLNTEKLKVPRPHIARIFAKMDEKTHVENLSSVLAHPSQAKSLFSEFLHGAKTF